MLGILLRIAFFTLLERKLMRLIHYRKGPNKIIFNGLIQPIRDAIKLITKEIVKIQPIMFFLFNLAPFIGISLIIILWLSFESKFNTYFIELKIFFIIRIISLTIFIFLLSSWGSNTKYSILGGYRALSQVISYEVVFIIYIFFFCYSFKSYNIFTLKLFQENLWILILFLPFSISWLLVCIAESNRTPFDLSEGESEIVSGFNIEYGRGLFALLFIVEYGIILFIRGLRSTFLLGIKLSIVKILLFSMFYIWIRCSFPRIRYDNLINLCWKYLLPFRLNLLLLSIIIFYY